MKWATLLSILCLLFAVAVAQQTEDSENRNSNNNNNWRYELYTPNALRHGIQGPGVSPSKVTVGSVAGQTIYQLNVNRGTFSTLVAPPNGESDDQAYGPDGTLVYTSLLTGLVRSLLPNGTVVVIGQNNPVSPNGAAYDNNGNAYYSTYPAPGADGYGIYRVDPKGVLPQQKVFSTRLPLNGFDFSASNEIFGPYPFTGEIVKINLATQTETVIASGFLEPQGVRFSADKRTLYVMDTGTSSVYSLNIQTGAKTLLVTVPGLVYLDNFRPYGDGLLISDTTSNSPVYVDLSRRVPSQRYVTPVSVFNLPGGIDFINGKVYVADYTAQRVYNTRTRRVSTIARSGLQPASAGAAAVNVSYGIYNVAASPRYLALSCLYDSKVQIRDINTNRVIVNTIPVGGAPYGLGFSNNGNTLLIADFFVGLRVNTGSNYQTSRIIPVGDNLVVGVAVSKTQPNTAYVTTYSGTLYAVNFVSGAIRVVATGFSAPEGIAVITGARGVEAVIVANVGEKNLVRVNAATGAKRVVASNLPIGLPGSVNFPPPNIFTGVTADYNGNVYVSSDLSDALIKVGGCRDD